MKGVDLLAPIMRELGDEFELHYTGGPASRNDQVKMPANMRDIGRLETRNAVAAAMQESDALLFPSRSEGFGLVAVEAMACGLPVIATSGSSLIEIVEDGVTGILCPEDDVEAFVGAARKLAVDSALGDRMSIAAGQRAQSHFSIDRMSQAYTAIYQSCT